MESRLFARKGSFCDADQGLLHDRQCGHPLNYAKALRGMSEALRLHGDWFAAGGLCFAPSGPVPMKNSGRGGVLLPVSQQVFEHGRRGEESIP